jgi:ABC-type uncharacterized transport system auxiliary subunit
VRRPRSLFRCLFTLTTAASLLSGCTHPDKRPDGQQPAPLLRNGYSQQVGKLVVVQGKALNSREAAVIVTSSVDIHVIGLAKWSDDQYGKSVKVVGTLTRMDGPPDSSRLGTSGARYGLANYSIK